MKLKTLTLPLAALSLALAAVTASAQPSIDGKWFSYGSRLNPPANLPVPVPEPIPDPPLKAEYLDAWRAERAMFADAEARGEPIATGYTHCLPDGMPTMMQGMFPMEVLESKGQVTIIQEAYQQIRRVYLTDEPLMPWEEAEPRFWGHSVGKWEGSVLVTSTVGIKESVMFRNVPHSAAMEIHERIYLEDEDHMVDEVTIIDPEYLEKPWQWTWKYQRNEGYKMYEYVCENNREFADPETGEARLQLFGD